MVGASMHAAASSAVFQTIRLPHSRLLMALLSISVRSIPHFLYLAHCALNKRERFP